jgi:hypothetical protein
LALNDITVKAAEERGYISQRLGFETWVLGPAPGGSLQDWFNGKPAESSYRLFIHRQARLYEGSLYQDVPCQHAHRTLRIRDKRRAFAELRGPAETLLASILARLSEGPDAIHNLMKSTGHPYWTSAGRERPSSRSL